MEPDLRLAIADFALLSLPQPLLVLDTEGRIVESNRAACGRSDVRQLFEAATKYETVDAFLDDLRCAGRASTEIDLSSGAIRLEGVAMHGWFIITVYDVAEQQELEHELHVLRSRAALALVAATLVHDFNNVLGPILLLSARLVDELDDESRAATLASEIHSAALLGTSLMRDVLSLSRPRAALIERVSVNDVVSERLGLLARLLGDSVEIHCTLEDAAGDVLVDRKRLEHALLNLAANARDAMPGGGSLTIATHLVNGNDGPSVALAITDTGVGMTEHVRQRACDTFFTTKGESGGTGIGLASVLRFARESGGRVTIESELMKGTTVTVSLPRLAASEPVASAVVERCAAADRAADGEAC